MRVRVRGVALCFGAVRCAHGEAKPSSAVRSRLRALAARASLEISPRDARAFVAAASEPRTVFVNMVRDDAAHFEDAPTRRTTDRIALGGGGCHSMNSL